MVDFKTVNLSSYYFTNDDLRDYYLSLPLPVRNRLDEAGADISTLGELKQVASHMLNN